MKNPNIRKIFLVQNYYRILAQTLGLNTSPVQAPPASGKEENAKMKDCVVNMFVSPKKRARRNPVSSETSVPVFKTVEQYHIEDLSGADANALEAYILHYNEEPRWISATNKKTREPESIPVLDVLVADRTGPICIQLWRDAAEKAVHDFPAWSSGRDELVILEIKQFWVKEETRRHCTPVRKLHSNERTMLCQKQHPTQESLRNEACKLNDSLYTRDFAVLKNTLPFVVSVCGIVTAVQEEHLTQSNKMMREFKLQDPAGKYVPCAALGRHSSSVLLEVCNEVILFFCTGSEGLSSGPGKLWIYDESHILLLRKQCSMPPAKICIELRGGGQR